ncbi:MAG: SAM-dependent methyltransferase, partial [Paracoccaceae bacterium]
MTGAATSPLSDLLIGRIRATGPITLADYMECCLLHPEHGYYTSRDPFGRAGDFITAPEISQMFGELIGLWLAQCWLDQGRPDPFCLAEIGPGRGTLMADILRAIRSVPGMQAAARVCLIEASPLLQSRQHQTLPDQKVQWCARPEDLPAAPLFLVANEFFDALPICQFQRREEGWAERLVGVDNGALQPIWGAPGPVAALQQRLADTEPGDIVEFCPALPTIAS